MSRNRDWYQTINDKPFRAILQVSKETLDELAEHGVLDRYDIERLGHSASRTRITRTLQATLDCALILKRNDHE